MATADSLRQEILQERGTRTGLPVEELLRAIREGRTAQAIDELLFFTPPPGFASLVESLEGTLLSGLATVPPEECGWRLAFATDLATRLASFMPRWNLRDAARHGRSALTGRAVEAMAQKVGDLANGIAAARPEVAREMLAERRAEAAVRFKAEAAPDPAAAAQEWAGGSLADHMEAYRQAVASSNLRRIADLRAAGETRSEVSNDYAAFLPYALHIGASFVTCNPPLVDIAWQADPPRWNAVADRLLTAHPRADGDELARHMTLEVVLSNMHLLRPIFLLTVGETGCVSLQVNPKRHDDAESMIQDATSIYEELRRRLDGGIPNVVFKLPATRAGLTACRALTAAGIGVNITVNFALFQHLRFADEIHCGQAIFSVLSHMSGRLAFPVRDELLGKLSDLTQHGIDEAQAREAAAWSGIIVLKRLHQLLGARKYDLARVKPLIASMRVYEGDAYRGLPSPIPDISEAVGTGILTVFPNVRRAYDRLSGLPIEGRQIEAPAPERMLPVLAHSEIFRQAYYLDVPGWGTDGPEMAPDHALNLDDEAATAAWLPVRNTLREFCKAYDVFVERIEGRRRLLALRACHASSAAWTAQDAASLSSALTHFDASTLREALQWLCTIEPDAAVGRTLRDPAVEQAMQARADTDLAALRLQTVSRHAA